MLDATNDKSSIRKVSKFHVFFMCLIVCCLIVLLKFTFIDTNYIKPVTTFLRLVGNESAARDAMSYIYKVNSSVLYNEALTRGSSGIFSASPEDPGLVTIRPAVTSVRPTTIENTTSSERVSTKLRPTTTEQQTTTRRSVTTGQPTTTERPSTISRHATNGLPAFEQNTSTPDALTNTTSSQQDANRTILWFNKPSWMIESVIEQSFRKCEYQNCHTSTDKSSMDAAAAVIFTLPHGLGTQPPVDPLKRNPDQAWVFFTLEAPSYYGGLGQPYFAPGWKSTMNWSMTYMRDADISFPYGTLEPRSDAYSRNYSAIYEHKTKLVAWFVSNCKTPGRREDYVQELKNAGLEVDIYGGCSKQGLTLPRSRFDDINKTLSQYFFYFSFENSICEDYVTEKLFANYNYDVIQVVRGGADYKQLLPTNSYINTADFDSPAKMVGHLKALAGNHTKYIEMLVNKRSLQLVKALVDIDPIYSKPFCTLCEKLNKLDENRRVYTSMHDHYRQDRCTS